MDSICTKHRVYHLNGVSGPEPRPSNSSSGHPFHPQLLLWFWSVCWSVFQSQLFAFVMGTIYINLRSSQPTIIPFSTPAKENFLFDYSALSLLPWRVLSLLGKVPGFCDSWIWKMDRDSLEGAGGKNWENDETEEPRVVGLQIEQKWE